MPEVPFGASTWNKLSAPVIGMLLNGLYSGAVGGPISASYDAESRTLQAFSAAAHHTFGFTNQAAISKDDGQTWTLSFNDAADVNLYEWCIDGWSLPHPSGVGRVHFQVRVAWQHAFLIGTGDIPTPGGFSLWADDGVTTTTFVKLQDLDQWPAFNAIPAATGGHATFNAFPTTTHPILIEGSGPDGEDAYWFMTAYSFDAGGTNNRQTFQAMTLWRSIDGGYTWDNVREMRDELGGSTINVLELLQSDTGRILLRSNLQFWYTDDIGEDFETAIWTQSIVDAGAGIGGNLLPMFGGTWFSFSQGTLTGPGATAISCNDGTRFLVGGSSIVPQNRGGFAAKVGATEILGISPGFTDPVTETTSKYSNDGGETFVESEPWIASITGELPVSLHVRSNGTPIVVTRGSAVYTSSDRARGTTQERTVCPLASAGLFPAAPPRLCGAPLSNTQCD